MLPLHLQQSLRIRQALRLSGPICHRFLSSTHINPPTPPPHAHAPLPTRRLVSLSGSDAPRFLQGLTTANIPSTPSTTSNTTPIYSAFLTASGRVLYDVFIYPLTLSRQCAEVLTEREKGEEGFLIEVDAREVGALAAHLKRFKLRAKIRIRIVEEGEVGVWGSWGNTQGREREPEGGGLDERAPGMGRRIVLPGAKKPDDAGEVVGVDVYDLRRIMMGVAEGQGEILKESALPMESNIDYMGGIDFRKGCYVGQELTIRTHHTGVVRKRILPVQLYDAKGSNITEALRYDRTMDRILPPQGSNIKKTDGKGRSAGKWLGGVGNVGLALCRLEVMTDAVLTGEGSQWKPEDEFKVEWEGAEGREKGEVMVKAFVPSWHKTRAETQKLHRPSN